MSGDYCLCESMIIFGMVMMIFLAMLVVIVLSILFGVFWFLFRLAYNNESIFYQLSHFLSSKLSGLWFGFFLAFFRRLSSWFFILWLIAWFLIRATISVTSTLSIALSSRASSALFSFSFLIFWFSLSIRLCRSIQRFFLSYLWNSCRNGFLNFLVFNIAYLFILKTLCCLSFFGLWNM